MQLIICTLLKPVMLLTIALEEVLYLPVLLHLGQLLLHILVLYYVDPSNFSCGSLLIYNKIEYCTVYLSTPTAMNLNTMYCTVHAMSCNAFSEFKYNVLYCTRNEPFRHSRHTMHQIFKLTDTSGIWSGVSMSISSLRGSGMFWKHSRNIASPCHLTWFKPRQADFSWYFLPRHVKMLRNASNLNSNWQLQENLE